MAKADYIEFLVMRHGQSRADLPRLKILEGRHDSPLSRKGLRQAALAAKWIAARYRPDKIVSSPLTRAKQTAELVASRSGAPLVLDRELLERNNGALAGLTKLKARKWGILRPGSYLPHETAPCGETLIEFRARAETFWSKLTSQCRAGQRILIVSHGQMIAMLFRCFLKLPLDESVRLTTDETGIHCWRLHPDSRRIVFTNSGEHLESGGASG